MEHYPAGSSHQRMGYMVAIKGWTWSETMLRLALALRGQIYIHCIYIYIYIQWGQKVF